MRRGRRARPCLAVLVATLVLLAAACGPAVSYKQVSLTSSTLETATPTYVGDVAPLRVAVAAILSPQTTSHGYDHLIALLSHRLDRPVELIQRSTYAETNELLRAGLVDLAFVCT